MQPSDGSGLTTGRPCAAMAVIPARNEEKTIARVVRGVVEHSGLPVVVVDDQSSDATAQLARQAGATVLSPGIQLGAWGAIQTGMRYAHGRGCSQVVTLDGDGQHDPRFIPDLLAAAGRNGTDVVIGACPERVSGMRRLAWGFFKRLTGLRLEDLTSGYRVYNQQAVDLLLAPGAALCEYQDMGILLLLEGRDVRIAEVPLQMQCRLNDKSRIFSTWWHVLQYMVHSSIICVAKRKV